MSGIDPTRDRDDMPQNDEKLRKINKAIAEMEKARDRRLEELADPNRAKVRALWGDLQRAVAALENAGESPADLNGDSLHVSGNTFSLSATGELIEH